MLCNVAQVFWYFPLKNQLETLLRSAKYQYLLLHETRRARSPGLMTDVYDTPRWRKVAGPPTKHLTRIVYQICVDGFPWSKRKHLVLVVFLLVACCVVKFRIIGGWDCKLLNNLQIPTVNNLNNLQISIVKIHVCCAGIGETVATLFL